MKMMKAIRLAALAALFLSLPWAPRWFGVGAALAFQEYQEPVETFRAEEKEASVTHLAGIEILIAGNSGFSGKELLKAAADELAELEESPYPNMVAEDAAFQMEIRYRQAGYAFAAVGYRIEEEGGKGRVLTFMVEEGPLVTVRDLSFRGNAALSGEELRAQLAENGDGPTLTVREVFVESVLLDAVARVKEAYYARGYQEVEIAEPQLDFSDDRAEVGIEITITEGPRYLVQGLELTGDVLDGVAAQLESAQRELTGQPYFPRRKLELRSIIAEIYANLGYPDARIEVTAREVAEKGAVTLVAGIVSGPQVRVSRLIFTGNRKTSDSFLESRMKLRPGEVYSLDKKRESFQELYHTGLFSKIDMELQPEPVGEGRALVVTLKEHPSKELYGEAGWGSYEFLRMRGGFRENNLFGKGRILKTEAGASFKNEDLLFKLTDPWFLGTEVTADLPLFYQRREEPAYQRKDSGGSLMFSREFPHDVVASAGYQYRRTSLTDIEIESAVAGLENNYNLGSAKVQIAADTRDDIFLPTSGYKLFFSEEYSDNLLGSDVKYLRSSGGGRFFYALRPDLVLGGRFDTGLILPLADQVELPLAERFYNGGENTVRSFRQDRLGPLDLSGDPVGGMAYNVLSLELRRTLYRNFSLGLFADLGNISPNRSRIEEGKPPYQGRSELVDETLSEYFNDFRSAVGVGLQYLLPVGPARLDFAFNPDRKPERDERGYAIHFSIGMAF